MKMLQQKNKTNIFLNILITFVILTIPFYAWRFPLVNTSLSILTCDMLILSTILFIFYYKNIIQEFKKEYLLWTFALLFVFSFIPSLILNPTTHGFGVFLEWILLPVLTSFLLYVYININSLTSKVIQNVLTLSLFIVTIISLIYFVLNIQTFDGRLASFYLSPNHLAFFITPLIPIAIANFFTSKHVLFKIFSLITFLLSLLILFFTNSFISSISISIVLIFITLIHIKERRLFFIPLVVFFIFIAAIGIHKITNIELTPAHNPLFSRIEIWTVATHHIQNNILLNKNSLDSFGQIYLEAQSLYSPYNTWSAPTPHNLILTLWISGGFFSVLFFCLICSRWLYISFSSYKKTKKMATLLYIAAFLTILLSSVFDTPFWKNDLSFVFWLILININNPKH